MIPYNFSKVAYDKSVPFLIDVKDIADQFHSLLKV